MVTEKCNWNAKYSCLLAIFLFVAIFVKQFAVLLALISKSMKIDAKVMELVLKCTKSKQNYAISKSATKAGNLEIEINVQYVCQAKLSKVT